METSIRQMVQDKRKIKKTEELRLKISDGLLNSPNIKRGNNHYKWRGGKSRFPDCKDCGKKLSSYMGKRCKSCNSRLTNLGKKMSPRTKELLRKINLGRTGERSGIGVAQKRIMAEVDTLEKQGFRCIPICKVIPDIIGIKNGKIYAIEIEYHKPNYNKYTQEIRNYYDDVIWIIRKK